MRCRVVHTCLPCLAPSHRTLCAGISKKFIGGNGAVVFGSDHNLLAYDPVTGGLMWAFTSGLYAVSAVGSAPTVGDGASSGLRFD